MIADAQAPAPPRPSPSSWSSQGAFFPLLPQELVRILHKALEAAQQEKRATSAYLASAGEKDRLELVRHKVRQIAELGRQLEALEQERDSLVQTASLREQQVQELQQHVQLLMDKNQAKQQVICKLSEKVTQDFTHPPTQPPVLPGAADRDLLSQQEKMEQLKVGAPPSRPRALGEGTALGPGGFLSEAGRTLKTGIFLLEVLLHTSHCINQKVQCNLSFPDISGWREKVCLHND